MSILATLLPALISAGGSIFGGSFGKGQQQTPIQQQQKELIDQLLSSLSGSGPYSDLFNLDEESFQRSYVDPMMSKFRNQIAPQIQQSYLSSGQQRGTGIEDTLSRAGVDIDQLLNQQYAQMQQGALNRKAGAIGQILGQGPGAPQEMSFLDRLGQSAAGYFSGEGFGTDIGSLISGFRGSMPFDNSQKIEDVLMPLRKGFEKEPQVYDWATGIQE